MASNAVNKFFKLYVSNLPWTVGQNELRQYFSKFGPVQLSTVVFDKSTGLSKHFGFVAFGNKQGFDDAQNVPEHKIDGHIIRISPANQESSDN